jgi:L-iditol 2-dehydrogenase
MPDLPDPGPGEVLVRLKAVGICGSDMHYFLEGGVGGFAARYPMVLGHEPGGEVAAVGKGVEGLKSGARVAVEPAILRKECEFSRSGRRHLSEHIEFMGGLQAPGALRQYTVVPQENCVELPASMSFADAAFIEPLAVVLHSVELAGLKFDDSVAVMGCGPIGLLAVAVAKMTGASRIIAADRLPHRLQRARELGADVTVDISKESVREAVNDLTGPGVHVVFDAAGTADSVQACVDCVRPAGSIVVIGIPSQRLVGFDFWQAMAKEVTLRVQKRSNGNDHQALDLMKRGLIRSDAIHSHFFPLHQGHKAFETMAEYSGNIIKPVIEL